MTFNLNLNLLNFKKNGLFICVLVCFVFDSENPFNVFSSASIMRYLAAKNNVADHWFPRQDLQKQAKVDEFINWQHSSVRRPCVELFIAKVWVPFISF